MKKMIIIVFGGLIAISIGILTIPKIVHFVVNISVDPKNAAICKVEERALNEKLIGVVSAKFRDSLNHDYETIEVDSFDSTYLSNIMVLDNSGLFDYIQKGDSIKKELGELEFYVSRNGVTNLFELNYDCEK